MGFSKNCASKRLKVCIYTHSRLNANARKTKERKT
jgi:hypothetical protein